MEINNIKILSSCKCGHQQPEMTVSIDAFDQYCLDATYVFVDIKDDYVILREIPELKTNSCDACRGTRHTEVEWRG